MRTRPMLLRVGLSLLAFCVSLASAQPALNEPSISVRLSLTKKLFKVGERIPLKVEITNNGTGDVFVGRELLQIDNAIYHLKLSVESSQGRTPENFSGAVDSFSVGPRDGFSTALAKSWIALPPGYFYGTILFVDEQFADFLTKPGKYTVRGTYSSSGMRADVYFNDLLAYPEELERIPFPSWKGDIKTNSVSLEIAPAKPPK